MARSSGPLIGPARMNRHDGSSLRFGANQYQVASLLAVLDESSPFEGPDHLPRGKRRKLGHESGGNSNSALKGSPLFGNRFPVGFEAFKVQRGGFFSVA